jgi:predicted extracellular nuclease
MKRFVVVSLVMFLAQVASADMVISEWMYSGTDGEFVEFTNIGPDPVDMTNWSYSDSDAEPGDVAFLDVFGVVEPGESVILTEAEPSSFRGAWGLGADIKIFGPNTNSNLGRNDQINLYDSVDNLIDQLSYGDETYPGTPRTQYRSCNIPPTDYDYTVAQTTWVLAEVGDVYGSWVSSGGDVASPGIVIPEPTTLVLAALCGLMIARRCR